MSEITCIAGFYKFTPLTRLPLIRSEVLGRARRDGVWGTILLAEEGINGTVAGAPQVIPSFMDWLKSHLEIDELPVSFTQAKDIPFYRLKVRIKKEIVTMGVEDVRTSENTGCHVSPEDWNSLIEDPDVLVLDARNDYEIALGSFDGAEDPHTKTFKEWPAYIRERMSDNQSKKIAMFCTGGIRCEKASALLRQAGIDEVYQLQGGIINYLKRVPRSKSRWKGDCFVFDERVALDHELNPSGHELCRGCRYPIGQQERASKKYETGVSCPRCFDSVPQERKAAFRERQRQVELAEKTGATHLGDPGIKR
ncbi:MAG: rhodanese-related sulfurtransferase [Pseudomonadota bacterium]